jgi:hypothetical protein
VERACHALALDDERHTINPLLWDERGETSDRIQQVWFSGAHSNVGGGYPKQGMSLVALDWMMAEAEQAGLRFLPADRAVIADHANVDDKLYDPRAGLGMFYRWCPRDIVKMCRPFGVRPTVHDSVIERIAHRTEDYAPGNVPADVQVAVTRRGIDALDDAAHRRAEEAQSVLAASGAGPGLLSRVRLPFVVGRISYYVYLVSLTLVLLGALFKEGLAAILSDAASPTSLLFRLALCIGGTPELLGGLVTGVSLSYVLSFYTDHRMSEVFSGFWHGVQPKLRQAMKRVKRMEQAREAAAPRAA